MNLMLRAFGQSESYTLRERANRIISLHQQFSMLIDHFIWKVPNKKTVEIDIRDVEAAYPVILQQVKRGLNAKVVHPIRYKEDDTADVPSSCTFLSQNHKDYHLYYSLGFPSHYGYPGLSIGIDKIHDEQLFNNQKVHQIVILFIKSWKPEMLCVTDRDYFHNTSKAAEKRIPWTGWCTYVSNELIEKAQQKTGFFKNLFQSTSNLSKRIDQLPECHVENIEGFGKLIWTGEEPFEHSNKPQVLKAMQVEQFFIENNIRLTI